VLFASIELAARIERTECNMLRQAAAAFQRSGAARQPFLQDVAGGLALHLESGSPFNKLAGLGFAGPVSEGELSAAEGELHARGAEVQAEVATLADPQAVQLLTQRGYVLVGFENVLGIDPRAVPGGGRAAEHIEISLSPASELDLWLDTVITGFATPDDQGVPSHEDFPREMLENAMTDASRDPCVRRYLARIDRQVAGGASLRLEEGVAQFTGAATLPSLRRRGVQGALLDHRLQDAAREGCDVGVITTQPGSTSMQNAQRRGFELLYARAVLVLPPSDG
jgi:GNAT superfamily N-acetyltransferase